MSVQAYRAGILPAGTDRILPPRLAEGQLFYAPLALNLSAIGGGDVTPSFTRASVATYHNGSGEIVSVVSGVPRFGKWGYFTEGSRTNLTRWSEDFTNAVWVKTNVTIAGNAFASPYVGAPVIADKIQENNANGYHDAAQPYTGIANQKDSISMYVHGEERTWCWFEWWDSDGKYVEIFFNTATGAFGTTNIVGTGISIYEGPFVEQLTGGWWRLSVTVQTSTQTARAIDIGTAQADNVASFTGTTGWGIYAIGGQAEADAWFSSSYIPTTNLTVLRAQDQLTYLALGNTPLGPIGTIECRFRHTRVHPSGEPGVTALATKDGIGQYGAEILFGASNTLTANVVSNSTQMQATDGVTGGDISYHGVWAFRPFSGGLYLDSALVGTSNTNSNLPYHNSITIGAAGTGGNWFWGWLWDVKIWEIRRVL